MTKFKNKKTGQIVEENLNFYVEKLRNNPNYKEVKEANKSLTSSLDENNKEVAK